MLLKKMVFAFTAIFSSALLADPSSLSAFGLALESSAGENKFVLSTPLALSENPEGRCEGAVLAVNHFGDDKELDDFGFRKRDQSDRFKRNIYGVDYSGRVSGGWHKVQVFEEEISVCFVYFDDKLMNVVTGGRPVEIHYKLLDALGTKYEATVGSYGIRNFDSPVGTVVLGSSLGITMSHEPLRAQFLHWAIELHKEAEEKASASSPF